MDTMRQIKFRAWDNKKKKMQRVYKIDFLENGDYEVAISVFESMGFITEDNGSVLMQSTGLLDQKGNEIYDGDILKLTYKGKSKIGKDAEWKEQEQIHAVKWGDFEDCQAYCQTWVWGYSSLFQMVDQVKKGLVVNSYWENKDISFEIVGNIHETPELITKT